MKKEIELEGKKYLGNLENREDLYLENGILNKNYKKGVYVLNLKLGRYGFVRHTYAANEKSNYIPRFKVVLQDGKETDWNVSAVQIFPDYFIPNGCKSLEKMFKLM